MGIDCCGITTIIPKLFEEGFDGSQVIVLDDSSDQTMYLYNWAKAKKELLEMICLQIQHFDMKVCNILDLCFAFSEL